MKLLIAQLVIFITLFIMTINNSCLSLTNNITGTIIFIYIVLIVIIFFIIITILDVIKKLKKDIIENIIISLDYNENRIKDSIQKVETYLESNLEDVINNTIHTIITDSKLHNDIINVKLNNNLIETHTTHELLKELFMLENDTNRLLHFDVDNNQQDLFCKQVIEDSINNTKIKDIIIEDDKVIIPKEKNSRTIMGSMVEDNILHLDKTLEESFIDNKIIPKEKNSRTINRRKKQQP